TNIVIPLRKDADAGLAQTRQLEVQQEATAAYQEEESLLQHRGARLAARRTVDSLGALAPVILQAADKHDKRAARKKAATLDTLRRVAHVEAPAAVALPPARHPPVRDEFRAVPITISDHVKAAATGLAVIFVPISALEVVTGI